MTKAINLNCIIDKEGMEPSYATKESAGMDLRAMIDDGGSVCLPPLGRVLIKTGFKVALPDGYEAQVRPRSGLAYKHGITVLNSPGTIDSDYRGDIGVILINLGVESFTVNHGDRIAQLVVAPFVQANLNHVEDLTTTERGDGGFGHTGKD